MRAMQPTIKSASHPVTNDVVYSLIAQRISPESRVLDFGAGLGHMCQRLGAYFEKAEKKPEDHLTACEVVPEIFQYTGVRCQKIGVDSVIPVPPASYDLVYAIEVLEHTFRPYDFFHQAFAALKPGGWLIVTVPNSLHFKSRLSFLFSGFAEMFGPCSSLEKNAGRICGHIMPLNFAYFVYALRKAGFSEPEFIRDRTKKSSLAWSLLFYPFLKAGSVLYDRQLRAYDKEVWEENRSLVYKMNSFEVLTSRSCIIAARKR